MRRGPSLQTSRAEGVSPKACERGKIKACPAALASVTASVPSRSPRSLENHSLLNSIGMGNRPVYWEKSLFFPAIVLRVFPLASLLRGTENASLRGKAEARRALVRAEQGQSRRSVRQRARFAAGRRSDRHSPRASSISTPRSVPAVGAPCAGMGAWMHSADQLPLRKWRMRATHRSSPVFCQKDAAVCLRRNPYRCGCL
jgi:hypothetical protein